MKITLTLDEANTYFTERLFGGDWFLFSEEEQKAAIKESLWRMNNLNFVDFDEVPDELKDATAEVSLALLKTKNDSDQESNPTIISESYMGVRVTYDPSNTPVHEIHGIPSLRAWNMLFKYLRHPYTIRMVRA